MHKLRITSPRCWPKQAPIDHDPRHKSATTRKLGCSSVLRDKSIAFDRNKDDAGAYIGEADCIDDADSALASTKLGLTVGHPSRREKPAGDAFQP